MSDDQLSGKWPTTELPAAWVWTQFSDFWSDYTDTKKKIPQKQYLPEGQFAVVDQGEALIGGYTNDERLLSNAPIPSIVFGDHTRAVKFVEVPFAQGADGVRVLAPPSGVEPRFAYEALRAVDLPNKGYSRHFKFLKATDFPLPPLAEQKRIVAKLDGLSARSARARDALARIDTLVKRYKQAVLSKVFVEVEAEAKPIRELVDFVTSGSRGWAKYYSDCGPLFLRIGNTQRGCINLDFDDVQRVSPPKGSEGRRTKLQAGDVLITITADLGRIGVVPRGLDEAYVNQHIALLRLQSSEMAQFLAWYLVSPEGQAGLHENDRGATRAGLGLDDIRNLKLPVPSPTKQKEIVRRIESAFEKIDKLAAEAKRALELTDKLDEAILAKAFRGELVPQDPDDEPASALLERIRTERAAAPKAKRGRRKK